MASDAIVPLDARASRACVRLAMRGLLSALVLLTLGAAGCASQSSQTISQLVGSPIEPGLLLRQPATIEETIGGRTFVGYVSVSYGDGDRFGITSRPGTFASFCTKKTEEWAARGRRGQAPCATAMLELDADRPNFWVASYWSAAPGMALSAKLSQQAMRVGTGFVPGTGGAVASTVVNSPLLDLVINETLKMYRDLFEAVGASTPETCEALRPPEGDRRLGDGHCRPARLDIY